MRLYHRTSRGVADAIVQGGFRDGSGYYGTDLLWTGVWLSDRPLDGNEGAFGDTLLAVEMDEAAVAEFEWVEDEKPYREFLVPASLVNERASICIIPEPESWP